MSRVREVLTPYSANVILYGPTEQGAAWYCEIDADGEQIPLGMATDLDSLLLEVAELLSDRYRDG